MNDRQAGVPAPITLPKPLSSPILAGMPAARDGFVKTACGLTLHCGKLDFPVLCGIRWRMECATRNQVRFCFTCLVGGAGSGCVPDPACSDKSWTDLFRVWNG